MKMFPGKEKYFSDRRYLHSHTIPFSDKCNKTVSIKPRVGEAAEPHHRHAANLVSFYWVQPLFSVLCFNINMFSTTFSTLFELAMDLLRHKMYVFTQNSPFSSRFLVWWDGMMLLNILHQVHRGSGWCGASWFVKWIEG